MVLLVRYGVNGCVKFTFPLVNGNHRPHINFVAHAKRDGGFWYPSKDLDNVLLFIPFHAVTEIEIQEETDTDVNAT